MSKESTEGIDWVSRPRTGTLLAEKLRQDLREGAWIGELPGIRPLMNHYNVSAPPVREALEILEHEGWISPARKGRNRSITRNKRPGDAAEFLLGRPEIEDMTWLTRVIYRLMTDAFDTMKIPRREVIFKKGRQHDFAKKLREELSERSGITGVMGLDVRHETIRAGVGMELPLLMIGSRLQNDPRCATVAIKLSDIIPQAIDHLHAKNVPAFSIISAGLTKPLYDSLLPVIRDRYETLGIVFRQEVDFPWIGPGELLPALRIMTREGKPRLLVTINEAMWARVLWEVRRMSHVVDVIAMWPSTAFMAFESPPCLCQVKTNEFIKHILKWHADVKLGRIPAWSHSVGVKAIWSR